MHKPIRTIDGGRDVSYPVVTRYSYDPDPNHERLGSWLPLVTVEYEHDDKIYHSVSPILTNMFLRGWTLDDLKISGHYLDPIKLDTEYHKLAKKAKAKFTSMDECWIQSICKGLSEAVDPSPLSSAPKIEYQHTPLYGNRKFDSWKSQFSDIRQWGRGKFKRIECVTVMPVVVRMYEEGEFLHPYTPLTIDAESVILKRLDLRVEDIDPSRRMFWPSNLRDEVHFFGVPNKDGFGIPAILLDAGYRVKNKDSWDVRIQKRFGTQLISYPTMGEMFDSDFIKGFDSGSAISDVEDYFGNELNYNDGEKAITDIAFPSANAASKVAKMYNMEIDVKDGGIGEPSYKTEEPVKSERNNMFVETWADNRKCIVVDVCGSEPRFYHEFVRCSVCNGQVELLAPQHLIPPTADCPHCSTANGISWEYCLTGQKKKPMTGDDSNEKNTK